MLYSLQPSSFSADSAIELCQQRSCLYGNIQDEYDSTSADWLWEMILCVGTHSKLNRTSFIDVITVKEIEGSRV